ncbi:hypothetical protein [Mycolicibacterium pyrenivorans]|uniref:hypothetical protein n=1 Tax=Mycolicibacterium pyrenivorans TaxID=187102 RepID=UPI000A7498A4|nr:hypothetical protein [Mycolicibacterium pyrenivorans]MCV7153946.1 hypothetical protein [Mycolicibacterium pyrenivorans]
MPAESSPAEELAGTFARMSGLLLTDQTLEPAPNTITSPAADTIAGSMGSGVSMFDPGGERTGGRRGLVGPMNWECVPF